MANSDVDPRLLDAISRVTGKRPRVFLDHILEHGHITTEDLANYGYTHAPRAARDVREAGIPLKTFRVRSSEGRSIAAYRLGNLAMIHQHKLEGRSTFSKDFARVLYELSGGRCSACFSKFERRYLQIDHRIPYEIAGDQASESEPEEFMLLCGTCQRKKSWSCEHCPNWQMKKEEICQGCFWVHPDAYSHIATQPNRRVELTFSGPEEVELARALEEESLRRGLPLPALIKEKLSG